MPLDLTVQVDLVLRLVAAAVLGALVGLEREIHEHPAGMRTHLLVSLGSAVFTEMSAEGFGRLVGVGSGGTGGQAIGYDPTRIAAQIVSGIGFLGAGAIIKYGTSIRGLTTAASLWVTAAIGLAAGGGNYLIAVSGAVLALVSLWPLNQVIDRLRPAGSRLARIRVLLVRLEQLGDVSSELSSRRIDITSINTQRLAQGHYEVELELRLPPGVRAPDLIDALATMRDVEVVESGVGEE